MPEKKDEVLTLRADSKTTFIPARTLHTKLAQIMYEAERIPKNGTAPQAMGGYRFVQVGDAADYIRKELADKKITMLPTSVQVVGQVDRPTKSGGTMTTVDLLMEWTLTDGDSGESIKIMSFGAGADGGDKYSGKASTSAMKYALLTGFLLSTGDDTEAHDTSGQGRPAPPRLEPRSDPATVEPPPAKANKPYSENEEMVGRVSRRGMVRKGTSSAYQAEWKQGPDGHVIGFRLEVGKDKHIPQCAVAGPLGEALFLASGGKPEAFVGKAATVAGILYYVRSSRASDDGKPVTGWYRLHVDRFENEEWILPADPADAPVPEPPEAPSVPLFDADEEANIDDALSWPA